MNKEYNIFNKFSEGDLQNLPTNERYQRLYNDFCELRSNFLATDSEEEDINIIFRLQCLIFLAIMSDKVGV